MIFTFRVKAIIYMLRMYGTPILGVNKTGLSLEKLC